MHTVPPLSSHSPLSLHLAENLLERLSTDDDFRALFVHDPAAALMAVGMSSDEAAAALVGPSCMLVHMLASKEDIARARGVLSSYLTSAGTHTVVHTFASGDIARRLVLATDASQTARAA